MTINEIINLIIYRNGRVIDLTSAAKEPADFKDINFKILLKIFFTNNKN